MSAAKFTVSLNEHPSNHPDVSVPSRVLPSRSQAVQSAAQEKIARVDNARLAQECAKLDPNEEQALADEGLMMSFREPDEAYRQMAHDEQREAEALEWAEAMLGDATDEPLTS